MFFTQYNFVGIKIVQNSILDTNIYVILFYCTVNKGAISIKSKVMPINWTPINENIYIQKIHTMYKNSSLQNKKFK